MLNPGWSNLEQAFGWNVAGSQLGVWAMVLRAIVVFTFAIVLLRCSDRRSIGHNASFDVVLGVIFGSVLSRAINGSAPLLPTLAASIAMVALHRFYGTLAFHSHRVSQLVKGRDRLLVKDGKVDYEEMKRAKITLDDLLENMRLHGNVNQLAGVQEARLERSGSISVVFVKRPRATDTQGDGK
ncbi:DUF421 domain-containing protein [Horticoccus luteus]|uniref:DUF421 domain-containing protein n=1 Tax=Horticoccus luteus TaxID=2862869 RepID=A0A8F9TVM1_9BACT|nr:YetF domain-containing protein [Horticoccus luteus]QYM79905.1 DUF421 domain-containing protein [Horticoccus luteus]